MSYPSSVIWNYAHQAVIFSNLPFSSTCYRPHVLTETNSCLRVNYFKIWKDPKTGSHLKKTPSVAHQRTQEMTSRLYSESTMSPRHAEFMTGLCLVPSDVMSLWQSYSMSCVVLWACDMAMPCPLWHAEPFRAVPHSSIRSSPHRWRCHIYTLPLFLFLYF